MSAEINFPTSLDDATSMPDPTQYDQIDSATTRHDEVETRQNNAIKAIEAKVGITGSAVSSSIDYRITALEAAIGSPSILPSAGDGSPEGVVTAGWGRTYVDKSVDPPHFWVKFTNGGNTGWRQLIG